MSYFEHGTVEFRQHGGTADQSVIVAWVEFVLALVRATLSLSEICVKKLVKDKRVLESLVGPRVYQAMSYPCRLPLPPPTAPCRSVIATGSIGYRYGETVPVDDQITEFLNTFEKYAYRLRHLTIRGVAQPETPFLDSIGRYAPSLQYLHLGSLMFGPGVFEHLPPSLRTLRLEDDTRFDFPLDELEDFGSRAGRAKSAFRSLIICVRRDDTSSYTGLADICRDCDVEFQLRNGFNIYTW
ncbi:hypothetical protein OBBRIDRAFT_886586 [Obba rivulosa]|uniref:Uncharacterized protein n=1 Tax=Obba rivulosa TaxID=1052685 RepID=A0A8E2AZG9_9APHY|nr:hypothetical protein OBBRIDRAFT_886586 [Obba rivulosa]